MAQASGKEGFLEAFPPEASLPPPGVVNLRMESRIEALYIHVPFCHTICPFCAFAVHGNRARLHTPFLESLEREAALRAEALAGFLAPLQSVYIGGGTPSTLSAENVGRLLAIVRAHFALAPDAEISLELNPEDARPRYLDALSALGVNRFSLGLQSLDDPTLRALGRNNDARRGREAWEALRRTGWGNFNADLMFGAPGIGREPFRKDVEWIAAHHTPHISLYGLEVEPGTRFDRRPEVREWSEDKRDVQADTYLWAVEYLTARGYHHYEVSNFSHHGREGRQNLIVWDGGAYLGLGPGAFSTVVGVRWRNARHLRAWTGRLAAGEDPRDFEETPTPAQQADETMMLALRRDTGLDIATWEAAHGQTWGPGRERRVARLIKQGQAQLRGGRLSLTPNGLVLADEITAALALGD